jgi:hypothetical protein
MTVKKVLFGFIVQSVSRKIKPLIQAVLGVIGGVSINPASWQGK